MTGQQGTPAGKSPKFFYGWVIVLAGLIITGGSVGTINNTLSAFIKPVTEDLGFARGQFTLYNSIISVAGMLMLPFYGELFSDNSRVKKIMVVCALSLGVVPWGYSVSTKLWQFYILAAIHGALQQGISFMAVTTIINNWFKDRKGLAIGIAMAGTGLFGAVMVPITSYVIDTMGWQWGYRLIGTVSFCLLVPTVLFLVKVKPSDMGLVPLGAGADYVEGSGGDIAGFTRAEAFKMPSFYLIMVGFFIACFVSNSMQAHTMSHLTDIGYTSTVASGFISLNMVVLMIGKVILGWAYDRFGIMAGLVSAVAGLIGAAIFLQLAAAPVFAALAVTCLAYGFASNSMSAGIITAKYFGNREYSRIFATVSMASTLSGVFGQPYPGFVYDLTGSYNLAWTLNVGIALCAVVFLVGAERSNRRAWKSLAGAPGESETGENKT